MTSWWQERVVFSLRPGIPRWDREGERCVFVCLDDEGRFVLCIPEELRSSPFISCADWHEKEDESSWMRFAIGGDDCRRISGGYIVRVGDDAEGRQYLRLPTAPEAQEFIRYF